MCGQNDTFDLNAGSDFAFSFNWPDGAGGNADLTGYTVSIFDASPSIASAIGATLTDAAEGLISVAMEWPTGLARGRQHYFQVKIAQGALDVTTNRLWIDVK